MEKIVLSTLILAGNLMMFAQADRPKPAYDFSWPLQEKIRLAESAAPPEVSGEASIYVLERSGYVKVRDGSNGFACFVDRQTPWNSEPTCFDAEGTATTLPTRLFVEEERARNKSEDQIKAETDAGYKSGRFRAPSKPGIVYMMSDGTFLLIQDKIVHAPPHLMFYAPYATAKDLGSPPPGVNMPHLIREGQPDAYIIVIPGDSKQNHH
jgi:hypothetical protein